VHKPSTDTERGRQTVFVRKLISRTEIAVPDSPSYACHHSEGGRSSRERGHLSSDLVAITENGE
jgi:hypothetical protein